MKILKSSNQSKVVTATALAGLAAVALVATIALAPRVSQATPQHAAETKLACTQCHTDPAGGKDKLTPFGKKFKDDGFKLPGK
jgi:hypothetical protein